MKIADIPTTNLRILVSLSLAVLYVVAMLVMFAFGRNVPGEAAIGLGAFILALMTADVVQFGIKRKTYQPPAEPQ